MSRRIHVKVGDPLPVMFDATIRIQHPYPSCRPESRVINGTMKESTFLSSLMIAVEYPIRLDCDCVRESRGMFEVECVFPRSGEYTDMLYSTYQNCPANERCVLTPLEDIRHEFAPTKL